MVLFETNLATSMADVVSQVNSFLIVGGGGNPNWTTDRHEPGSGEWAISQAGLTSDNDIQVAFQWDTTSVQSLGIYQYNHASGAGNYDAGRAGPWDQDEDSGNGAASTAQASLILSRHVHITDTPVRYWVFAGRSPHVYAYIVVQVSATLYSHFGFGELDKFNDWTGGAFAYGQRHQGGTTNNIAVKEGSTALLDGLVADGGAAPSPSNGMELFCATINAESLPGQVAGGRYAIHAGNQIDLGLDRQSNDGSSSDTARALFIGGFRANEVARSFGNLGASPSAGFVPGYPLVSIYWDRPGDEIYGPMSLMPGVRGIHMGNFAPGDEIVDGSDTWVVFPTRWKSGPTDMGGSVNQGIMYKKN